MSRVVLLESSGHSAADRTHKIACTCTLQPSFKAGYPLIKVEGRRCFDFEEPDRRGTVNTTNYIEIL